MKPEALLKAGFTFLTCLLLQQAAKAQLKMGGDSPASLRGDALLELNSNKQGLLLPRISLAALSQHPLDTAANGLVVFVKEQNSLFVRKNATWQKMFDADNLSYTIDLLGDVAITTPTTKQLLRYDGTNWANWTPDFATLAASLNTGSLLFADASGAVAENNANIFWDNTNSRLGIGTNASLAQRLTVDGDVLLKGNVKQYFSATTDHYIGVGRNNNFSLVSDKTGSPLRIGANSSPIYFFSDGNAAVTDVPQMQLTATGNLGINEPAPASRLSVGGSIAFAVKAISGNITLNENDYMIAATATSTVTLPQANTCPGRVYVVKRASDNDVTVQVSAGDSFDSATGATAIVIDNSGALTGTGGVNNSLYKAYTFVSGGAANLWYVIF